MSFKYDFTLLFDYKTNQTKRHTGWSSRGVVGSWVTSGHLSAPGCSGSRVCCYRIHPWNPSFRNPKSLDSFPACPWDCSPCSPCSVTRWLCPILAPGCPCPGGQPWLSLQSFPVCWWRSFLLQNLCSRASFSLPQFLLHRTTVGVRHVPTICHGLEPA